MKGDHLLSPIALTPQRGLVTARLLFASTPTAGNKPIDLVPYRQVLQTFVEKNRPLLLPDWDNLPGIGKEVIQKALSAYSSQDIATLKAAGYFGIGEESCDSLYYLTNLAAQQSGILTPTRFAQFYQQMGPLLTNGTADSYRQINELAQAIITPQDIAVLKGYFPTEAAEGNIEAELKRMLGAYFSDYAIGTAYHLRESSLASREQMTAKLQEELDELIEHFTNKAGAAYSGNATLKPFIQNPPQTPADFQNAIQGVLTASRGLFSGTRLTLPNLLTFSALKSECRTEYAHTHPQVPYLELKYQAKAWEKFFEAYLLR